MALSSLRSLVAATAVGMMLATAATAQQPPAGWKLVWSDDFDKLDTSRWTLVDSHAPTNNSRHASLPGQVSVEDGRLVLLSENKPSGELPYRSGQVISKPEWTHGRWEVRAKLPTTLGMWPAIWLLPDVEKYKWPSGGEIDIMENRGNEPMLTSSAFHYGTNPPYHHEYVYDEQQTRRGEELVDYSRDFHTYAVEWEPSRVRFYVDGVNHYTVYNQDVGGFLTDHVAPMQLVINTAVGGEFLPDPDATTVWPQRLEVDWVRVYQRDGEASKHSLTNADFAADGGSLRGWSLFGSDLRDNPNVTVASGVPGADGASLKLFGTFGMGAPYCGASQGVTVQPGEQVTASVRSQVVSDDSISGTDNTVYLKLEFYSEFGARFDSPQMLGFYEEVVANGQTADDQWLTTTISQAAPEGASEARLSIVFHQPSNQAGAVFVDDAELRVEDAD